MIDESWLALVLKGAPDEAAVQHLQRGFATWLKSGSRARRDSEGVRRRPRPVSLARCLGLPENPMQVRQAQRDEFLRYAARLLPPHDTGWSRSQALCAEVRKFAGQQWLAWLAGSAPPPYATDLQRALFHAMRAGGGEVPRTARGLHKVLNP